MPISSVGNSTVTTTSPVSRAYVPNTGTSSHAGSAGASRNEGNKTSNGIGGLLSTVFPGAGAIGAAISNVLNAVQGFLKVLGC